MKIAVITPYFSEPSDVLKRCHESVLNQSYPCTHYMVSDGAKNKDPRSWKVNHIELAHPHGDNGNTPRCIASLSAMNSQFDAIAYLDADNWYERRHIETMIELHLRTGSPVCTATRNIHRLDGTFMYTDRNGSDGKAHVDTSCLFLSRSVFSILPLWAMMPRQLSPICDRVFWNAILARGFSSVHNLEPTVAFRTQYRVHYENLGETPPLNAKTNDGSTGQAYRWWELLSEEDRTQWKNYLGLSGF
jgi:glycosyltransferase involved in cell wall biosynthesis